MRQRTTFATGLLTVALATGFAAANGLGERTAQERTVALRAGTIHLVDEGRVLEDATVLVRDGKILAVGSDLDVPPGARLVDYGPDAVIVPGLVAAHSNYGPRIPSPRTASPGTRAIDAYDPYRTYADALAGGVTSAYLSPSDYRLIGGTGALVKTGGEPTDRVVNASAALQGSIDALARNTPGYWEPPVPATVDGGMKPALRQLPRSAMGAIVALNELVGAARSEDPADGVEQYGRDTLEDLAQVLQSGLPWRMSAVEENEIRALLSFAAENEIPLVLEKALQGHGLAEEIAAAGIPVVFRVPYQPNRPANDYGKDKNARWPRFDVPAALVKAGARVAITGSSPGDQLFFAALASRGGLDPQAALRAITLTPAEICGAADRVGSIRPGKDADFCVLGSDPFGGYASVLATWIDGTEVWSPAKTSAATVFEVEALHVGDGRVLRPGQILVEDGRIREVAERVSHPRGARVVRGQAAMPGMIDAFGHLGLEGASKVPGTDFAMASIIGPGDEVDRRVAAEGITTVVLTPRGASRSGAPVLAYKPAASDLEDQIVGDPVALRLAWSNRNRIESGNDVRELLAKGAEYRDKWSEYERELAAWTPPPPAPAKEKKDADEDEEEEKGDEEDEKEKKDEKKSKKKKKGEKEELEPDPITGAWAPEDAEAATLKTRLLFERKEGSGPIVGNLRCSLLSDGLIEVTGYWDREENELKLRGLGTSGWMNLVAKVEEKKLVGKANSGDTEVEFTLARTSKEYVVAKRPERRKVEEENSSEPKGKPKAPRPDPKLEPLRSAMADDLTIVVEVNRADEILECVAAFEVYGIRPVLYGAQGIEEVVDEIAGRVRGVLLPPSVRIADSKRGTDYLVLHSALQTAGVPVAFHSGAEEGAIDLPLQAAYAVANGLSPLGALRALTSDAAEMLAIEDRVGTLAAGKDADVLLLDGPPLAPGTSVLRAWVAGEEILRP